MKTLVIASAFALTFATSALAGTFCDIAKKWNAECWSCNTACQIEKFFEMLGGY